VGEQYADVAAGTAVAVEIVVAVEDEMAVPVLSVLILF
jgi:hypothetical protein